MEWTNEEMVEKLFGEENALAFLIPKETKDQCKELILNNEEVSKKVRDLINEMMNIKYKYTGEIDELLNGNIQNGNSDESSQKENIQNGNSDENIQKENIQKGRKFHYIRPKYAGSCGIKLAKTSDPRAQEILDKYLPRQGLNSHSYDLIKIFNERSFKELRESEDNYPFKAFLTNTLNYIFMANDRDFQIFLRESWPDLDTALTKYGELVSALEENPNYINEIFTYLYSIDVNSL